MISRIRQGSSPAFQKVCHWSRGSKGLAVRELGPRSFKDVARPLLVYALVPEPDAARLDRRPPPVGLHLVGGSLEEPAHATTSPRFS